MSTTSITKEFRVGGVLTDMTSVVMSEPNGTYGVKRNDNDAVVVADGTAMTKTSTGTYTLSFTDPALDLTYSAWVEWVFNGVTRRDETELAGTTTAEAAAEAPAAGTSLATLTGTDITQDQIRGMIAEIDQFILTLIADRGAELVYSVDDRSVNRAAALKTAKELRAHYATMLAMYPGEEEILYEVGHGGAHHMDFVHRLTHP